MICKNCKKNFEYRGGRKGVFCSAKCRVYFYRGLKADKPLPEVPEVDEVPTTPAAPEPSVAPVDENTIMPKRADFYTFCTKHKNTYKGKCGCK